MEAALKIIKWVLIIFILLLGLASFMSHSYLQTLTLLLAASVLAYWPRRIESHWSESASRIARTLTFCLSLTLYFVLITINPKESIYRSTKNKELILEQYHEKAKQWPKDTEDIFIQTTYGKVHVLACGSLNNPPLLLLHAACLGAPSWAENINSLVKHYRIYAIDHIGEGNKSELTDPDDHPKSGKDEADLYALLADSLGIDSCSVIGASYGGYIALNYAYYFPQKVESLILIAPLGITPLTNKSIFMLSIASFYPFSFVKERVSRWTLGNNKTVQSSYGPWFDASLEGVFPRVARPVLLSTSQKKTIKSPVLVFFATHDPLVGDPDRAAALAADFPSVHTEILESGHLISVERADYINNKLREFLNVKVYPIETPEINNIESIKSSKQISMITPN